MRGLLASRKAITVAAVWLALLAATLACSVRSGEAVASEATGGPTAPVAVGSRVVERDGLTRLSIDLSAPVRIGGVFAIPPDRIVVDLPDINFQLGTETGRLASGVGLVRGFRFGTAAPGRSRIVLDLAAPAELRRADVRSIAGGAPSRLVLDLAPANLTHVSAKLDPPGEAVAETPAAAPAPDAEHRTVVVIDPGHGGADPGAGASTRTPEKDIVLAFAKTLAAKLEERSRLTVVLTRQDDRFVSLADRVAVARRAAAALFVSIHADMLSDSSVTGATVYTVSEKASDAEAARVAATENEADQRGGLIPVAAPPDVSGILVDLARRETRASAHRFQHTLTGYLAKVTGLNHNPERSAGFKVLQAPDVPSVLVELGYLSSSRDRADLMSPAWRERAATTVADAIGDFFAGNRLDAEAPPASRSAAIR